MAILAGEGVDDEHQLGVEYDRVCPAERRPPWSATLDVMLGCSQMVVMSTILKR